MNMCKYQPLFHSGLGALVGNMGAILVCVYRREVCNLPFNHSLVLCLTASYIDGLVILVWLRNLGPIDSLSYSSLSK